MSVVFTDNFTVSSDTNIDAYPSGSPDYAYVRGSGAALTVQASTDRAILGVSDTSGAARIIDTAAPTGDQQITGTVRATIVNGESSYLIVRAAGGENYYSFYLDLTSANEVIVYRRHNGSPTVIASADRGLAAADASFTARFKATGTNPVALELQINATAVVPYSDTHADRKQTGTSGLGGYTLDVGAVWIDDISVDNLSSGGTINAFAGKLALAGKL